MVDLHNALGREGVSLRERLGNARDWSTRFDLAEAFVAEHMASKPGVRPEIAWAYGHILGSGGRTRIATLAGEIGWSRKHLAAEFTDAVGLGPKTLSRIVRFNRALRLSATQDWAGIAVDCGYADQAHLAREFRQMAGHAPTALAI